MDSQVLSNSGQQLPTGTKRIEYIDALRGFTMFLVVACHVTIFCFSALVKGSSFAAYLVQIRMPLFFFISGFVLFKQDVVWNSGQIVKFFKKKIPVQLISPFLFYAVYVMVFDKDLVAGLFEVGKYGYWFTYALLVFYVIYAAIRFAVRSWWADVLLVLVGLCLYIVIWPGYRNYVPLSDDVLSLLSVDRWYHFIFFVFGTLTKKYFSKVEQMLDGKWVIPICVLFYFLVNVYAGVLPVNGIVILPFLSLTGIVIVFSFFRQNRAVFSKERRLGRIMQYTGRRTLDIYLLHYFFIPYNLTIVTVFKDHPMPVLEFAASSALAILIIALCLLVSNVIRLSPFLAHWLFGVKKAS